MDTFAAQDRQGLALSAAYGQGSTAYRGHERYAGRYIVGGLSTRTVPVTGIRETYRSALYALEQLDTTNAETLGVWVQDGIVYADAGDTWLTRYAAEQAAKNRGELAYWDRVAEAEVFV